MSDPKFTLTKSLDATTEKKLARHKANVILFDKGVQRSGAEFFGYIFLLGRELEQIAAVLPGEFEGWMAAALPDVQRSKIFRYREFYRLALPKVEEAMGKTSPTVGLSQLQLSSGKGKISSKVLPAIVGAVRETLAGKTMMEFMREEKFLKEAEEPGGYNYDPEKLKKWLAKHHPELEGKTYEELPEKVQKEFARFDLGSRDRRSAHEVAIEQRDSLVKAIVPAVAGKWLMVLSAEERGELRLAAQKLLDKLNGLEGSPSPKASPQGEDSK